MFGQMDIINGAVSLFKMYNNGHSDCERQLLDPLTTMIKLAILAYKPSRTKIAIANNRITFQDPDYLQGIWRWTYGNTKFEVHHLLNPIIKAVKRYDISNPHIKNIFQLAVLGLDKLKSTYNNNSSVVCHSLDLYMTIINNVLQKEKKNAKADSKTDTIFNSLQEDQEILNHLSIFQNLWSDDEIGLISDMLNQCKTDDTAVTTYLLSINNILDMKDARAKELLLQVTNKF